ncbi:hypothetical protein SEPCBS57363_006565 [Sporothrix epigloea]|uniref:Uncharacterized protein n=1 Tax=Sporothrix epigloea TaxID=1892477 RepID=A0ABP0E462_9PEZI
MQSLYATGFNAWGQLQMNAETNGEPDDIQTFTRVLDATRITHVRPSLSYTTAGTLPAGGAKGYSLIAEALNGRVVVYDTENGTLRQYQTMKDLVEEGEFSCFPDFPGVVQVVAYNVGFAVLTTNGAVWTWGDSRYPECLGRTLLHSPAHVPGRLTILDDLPTGPIVKLAAGGYVLAALTKGHDLYCWGGYPGQQSVVLESLVGEPAPVIVSVTANALGADDVEEAEIVDVGVGDRHMIILTANGEVCVIGSNANGQLGLGREWEDNDRSDVLRTWKKVDDLSSGRGGRVTGVYAGSRTSFVVVIEE